MSSHTETRPKPPVNPAELRGPINDMIADRMRVLGLETIRDFANHAGVSRTFIHNLVRGRSTLSGTWTLPSIETLIKLAAALAVPTHQLLYLIEPEAPGAGIPLAEDVTQVPVAVAGQAGAGPEQLRSLEEYTYVEREFATGRDLLAFRVTGDSMAGGKYPIYSGDLVIVDRNVRAEVSNVVVARLNNDGYICKRLRPGNILDSANPDFTDPDLSLIAPDRIAEVLGKVIRITHVNL